MPKASDRTGEPHHADHARGCPAVDDARHIGGTVARTERREIPRVFSQEGTWARKFTRRQARAKARALMQQGKHEIANSRVMKGTGGWISW